DLNVGPITWHSLAEDDFTPGDYIVFAPFAGRTRRAIPPELQMQILQVLAHRGEKVVGLQRSYLRRATTGNIIHMLEVLPTGFANVVSSERSCPSALRATQHAKAVICSHSSIAQEAFFRRKPTFLVYPDHHHQFKPHRLGTGYTWGAN